MMIRQQKYLFAAAVVLILTTQIARLFRGCDVWISNCFDDATRQIVFDFSGLPIPKTSIGDVTTNFLTYGNTAADPSTINPVDTSTSTSTSPPTQNPVVPSTKSPTKTPTSAPTTKKQETKSPTMAPTVTTTKRETTTTNSTVPPKAASAVTPATEGSSASYQPPALSNSTGDSPASSIQSMLPPAEIATSTPSVVRMRTDVQQLFDEYKKHHSHEQLLLANETKTLHNRKYVLGVYTCPNQAGNRIHDFTSAMVGALITNRTLLWKYYDPDTCSSLSKYNKNGLWCGKFGSYEDCHQILGRADWIPSYDVWASTLGLAERPQWWLNETVSMRRPQGGRYRPNETLFVSPDLVDAKDLRTFQRAEYLKYDIGAENRSKILYSRGTMYLYGMLFHEIFPLLSVGGSEEAKTKTTTPTMNTTREVDIPITISLHSRHWHGNDNGTRVLREKKCLQQVFQKLSVGTAASNRTCNVYLMSDREPTIDLLTTYLKTNTTCNPIVADHKTGSGLTGEHGPFAGRGYFDDLEMGRQARDGFVGHCGRSSSQLLWELIEYDRVEDAMNSNISLSSYPDLVTCCLPTAGRTISHAHPDEPE